VIRIKKILIVFIILPFLILFGCEKNGMEEAFDPDENEIAVGVVENFWKEFENENNEKILNYINDEFEAEMFGAGIYSKNHFKDHLNLWFRDEYEIKEIEWIEFWEYEGTNIILPEFKVIYLKNGNEYKSQFYFYVYDDIKEIFLIEEY